MRKCGSLSHISVSSKKNFVTLNVCVWGGKKCKINLWPLPYPVWLLKYILNKKKLKQYLDHSYIVKVNEIKVFLKQTKTTFIDMAKELKLIIFSILKGDNISSGR